MEHVSLVWPKTKEYTTVVGRDDLFYNIDRRYVMQLWKWFEYFFRLTKVNRKNFTKGYQLRSTNMFTVILYFRNIKVSALLSVSFIILVTQQVLMLKSDFLLDPIYISRGHSYYWLNGNVVRLLCEKFMNPK